MYRRFVRGYATKFQEGDIVMVKPKGSSLLNSFISKPISSNNNQHVKKGFIRHSDILGSYPNDRFYVGVNSKGEKMDNLEYSVSFPSTEEYINLIKRRAQPIYSLDASAIVNVADLHIDYPQVDKDPDTGVLQLASPPLQFLEAGTGHGSLTLAICKNLHPANAYSKLHNDTNLRGAILHSIDRREEHSATGSYNIANFRRGMYRDNVEFHVSKSPSYWLESDEGSMKWKELYQGHTAKDIEEKEAFLDGVFLDMADSHKEVSAISKYMKLGAPMVVFCPSITQILDVLRVLEEDKSTHLEHVRTLQLLDGAGGGLKEWDTRTATIRATGEIGWVCRPKVGVRVVAGGFVVVLRKAAVNLLGDSLKLSGEKGDKYSDIQSNNTGDITRNSWFSSWIKGIKSIIFGN